VRTPATSVRSLIETGNPASQPASPAASVVAPPCMMRRARSRARSRHRVGSAFTAGSTSAMRWAEASTSSRGEISRFLSRARASTADIRQSSLVIECFPTSAQDRDTQLCPAPRRTTALSHAPTAETFPSRPLARYFQEQRRAQDWKHGLCEQRGRRAHLPPRGWLFKRGGQRRHVQNCTPGPCCRRRSWPVRRPAPRPGSQPGSFAIAERSTRCADNPSPTSYCRHR
jgi:hypothetical protein